MFLVGCHRSGTTTLRRLLDAHPHIACPPESKFIAGFEAFLTYPQTARALTSLGVSLDTVLVQFGSLTNELLIDYARRHGKTRWVDKTPNYYRLLDLIDRMFSRSVLFVFIVRHPFDTIASLDQVSAFSDAAPEDPEIASARARFGAAPYCWAHYWVEVNSLLLDFAPPDHERAFLLKYENLVRRPNRVLNQLLDFLSEPRVPQATMSTLDRSRPRGYGDAKAEAAERIYSTSVNKPRFWSGATQRALWSIVAPMATRLGYQEDGGSRTVNPTRRDGRRSGRDR